jgi:beta-mannanase
MGVNNVAYVWQSKGAGATRKELDDFYPGDDYVDWVAFSFCKRDCLRIGIRFS